MNNPQLVYTIKVNDTQVELGTTSKVSDKTDKNKISVSFTTDQSLKYYEIRCTKDGDEYGIGIGNILLRDTSLAANTTHTYNIYVSKDDFDAGEGLYRLGLYAKGSVDGSWDVTYLLVSSNDYIMAPSDYDGIEIVTDEAIPVPEYIDYLCFTANEDNCTIYFGCYDSLGSYIEPTLEYSFDKITWTEFENDGDGVTLENTGDKVYFRGDNDYISTNTDGSNWSAFKFYIEEGSVSASGNVMSILDKLALSKELQASYTYCLADLFLNCTALVSAPNLPATILADGCYCGMFSGCTSLTTAPKLPATILADGCYDSMFYGCTSLTKAPELPATELAADCYYLMFKGCTSLYVSDTSGEGYDKLWTIPNSGAFTNTYSQSDMFKNCKGTRSSDNMAGASGKSYTYYTQNDPI